MRDVHQEPTRAYYVVAKMTNLTTPSVGRLVTSEEGIFLYLGGANAQRAKDFDRKANLSQIEWLDGSDLARSAAAASNLPVRASEDSLWLVYGSAYLKDRGAAGARVNTELTERRKEARSSNLSAYWDRRKGASKPKKG